MSAKLVKKITLKELKKNYPKILNSIGHAASLYGYCLNELCGLIDEEPEVFNPRVDGELRPYRSIVLQLENGSFVALDQEKIATYYPGVIKVLDSGEVVYRPDYRQIYDDNWPKKIHVELQLGPKDYVYEEDLNELIRIFHLDTEQIQRCNYIYQPNRKSSK